MKTFHEFFILTKKPQVNISATNYHIKCGRLYNLNNIAYQTQHFFVFLP